MSRFEDGSLDFIYIDASHDYSSALEVLRGTAVPLRRSTGGASMLAVGLRVLTGAATVLSRRPPQPTHVGHCLSAGHDCLLAEAT